jgi:hypothetical protein
MAWEYLEQLDYRYEFVSDKIGSLDGEIILDFNSGNSRLKNYLKGHFTYLSNDIWDNRADYKITDEQFLHQQQSADIICGFGLGGFEISKEKLESSTLTQTLINATIKYEPKIIVLEYIIDFRPIKNMIVTPIIKDYTTEQWSKRLGHDRVMQREITICRRKSSGQKEKEEV